MRGSARALDEHSISEDLSRADRYGWRRLCRQIIRLSLAIIFILELGGLAFAQRTTNSTNTGSKRGFILYGDVKVDESQNAGSGPAVLDVILYTNGNQVYARQRVTPNGRYRFLDVFDGDYYLVVEYENKEVARAQIYISTTSPVENKQDFNLELRASGFRSAGVVNAANLYDRSGPNQLLYQKSAREIESKNYEEAIAILRQLVAADSKDFVAWSDLGMLYFIKKDYEAAENSYASALTANPGYFPALLSQGRVQLVRKNFDRAIESLEAALKLDSRSAAANYFLGEAYLQIKKGSKAVAYLNQALKLDPSGMADAHLRLGALYNAANLKDRAALEYEEFLKKRPEYADRSQLEKYIKDNKKP